VGFWVGESEQGLLDDIDDAVDWRDSSRSEWLKDAARMYLQIEETFQNQDEYFPNERAKRATTQSALVAYLNDLDE
jgi:hypothetical protein